MSTDRSVLNDYILELKQVLRQRGELENRIRELEKANTELRDKVRRLESKAEYVVYEIRNAKEGNHGYD